MIGIIIEVYLLITGVILTMENLDRPFYAAILWPLYYPILALIDFYKEIRK